MSDWLDICELDALVPTGARRVETPQGDIAIFRTSDNLVFALVDRCPHKGGPLSQGIVHGHAVACPLHNWNISLSTGEALGSDKGCTPKVAVRVENGRVAIQLPGVADRAAA
jgi:nitrite reductase (NADH) small subunit